MALFLEVAETHWPTTSSSFCPPPPISLSSTHLPRGDSIFPPRLVHSFLPHHLALLPRYPPLCSSLLLTRPSSAVEQSGPHGWGREQAKSTGPEPEQRSWAARAQISSSSEWHWSSPVPWAPAGGEEIRAGGRSRLRPERFQEPVLDCLWNWITDYSQMSS